MLSGSRARIGPSIQFLPRNEWEITGEAGDQKNRAATAANSQGPWSTRCRGTALSLPVSPEE